MRHELPHIEFDEFVAHLQRVFEQVRDLGTPVLIERDGETYRLERDDPDDIWQGYDPERARRAFSEARGMFAGTDRERFLREMHEQREQGPNRPE